MTQIIWPDNETTALEELTRKLCPYADTLGAENVVAIIPLYTNEAIDHISEIDKKCRELPYVKSLHILGLRSSLAPAVSGRVVLPHTEAEHKAIRKLPGLSLSDLNFSYSLIEENSLNGEQIGFVTSSLAEYLAQILSLLCSNFDDIVTTHLLSDFQGWNLALGVSSIKYDIKHAIKLINTLTWREALTKAGFPTKDTDNKRTEQLAAALFDFPKDCYERFLQEVSVHTLRQTNSLEETLEISQAESDKFFAALFDRLDAFVLSPEFTFKEREQTLSKFFDKNCDFEILSDFLGNSLSGVITSELQVESQNAIISDTEHQLKDLQAEIEQLQEHPFKHFSLIKKLLKKQERLQNEILRQRQNIQEAELMQKVGDMWSKKAYLLYYKICDYRSSLTEFCRVMNGVTTNASEPCLKTKTLNDDGLLVKTFGSTTDIDSLMDVNQMFKDYAFNKHALEEIQSGVRNTILRRMQSYFSSFSIAEYLMGQEYPYMTPANCEDLLAELHKSATPASHSSALELPQMERLMFVGTDAQRLRAWKAATDCLQPQLTQTFPHQDPSEIILLSIQPIPLEYCR